jgi:hypothetical protein
VAEHGAEQPERRGGHHNYGLQIAPEQDRQNCKNDREEQQHTGSQLFDCLLPLPLAPLEAVAQTAVPGEQLRQEGSAQIGKNFVLVSLAGNDVGGGVKHPASVHPLYFGIGPVGGEGGCLGERDQGIVRYPDQQLLKDGQAGAFIFGQSHHHLDFIITTLLAQCFRSVKGVAELGAQFPGGEAL